MRFVMQFNTSSVVLIPITFGSVPAFYTITQPGGGTLVGAGTLSNVSDGFSQNTAVLTTQNSDTNQLSGTQFAIYDALNVLLGTVEAQVVNYDPANAEGDAVLAAVQPHYAPSKAGDAMTLTGPALLAVAAAVLTTANGVDVGCTVQDALRVMAAVLAGKTTIAGPIVTFPNWAGTRNRVIMQLAPGGTRPVVTFDFS